MGDVTHVLGEMRGTAAAAPGALDRFRQLLRRNPLAFRSIVVAALSIGTGLGGVLWQAHEARQEAAKARAVKDLLVGILSQTGTGEQLLDVAADRIRRELKDSPDVRNELLIELASIHGQRDAPARAEALYRELLALVEAEQGPRSLDAADARVRLARSLRNQQRYAEADPMLAQAAADAAGPGDRRVLIRGRALTTRCEISFVTRTLDEREGLRMAEEAVNLLARFGNSPDVVDSLYALARMHETLGQFSEAAEVIGRGLTVAQATWGEGNNRIPGGRHMRSRMLLALGRFTEGEEEVARAADQFLRSAGENHHHTVEARAQLAVYLDRRGAHGEALAMMRKALVRLHELRSPDDPLSLETEVDLGVALVHAGRVTEADELLGKATRLRTQPAGSRSLAAARLAHGRALELLGEPTGAAEAYEEARALGAPPLLGLAEVALRRGEIDAAEEHLRAATARLPREEGWAVEPRRQARVLGAALLLARRKPDQALVEVRTVLAETEADRERAYLHAVESSALLVAARAQLALGRPQESVTPAGRALEILRRSQWEGSPVLVDARLVFAEGLAVSGDAARARAVLDEARAGAALQPRAAAPLRGELQRVAALAEQPDSSPRLTRP